MMRVMRVMIIIPMITIPYESTKVAKSTKVADTQNHESLLSHFMSFVILSVCHLCAFIWDHLERHKKNMVHDKKYDYYK
jgi:hypothetical protein